MRLGNKGSKSLEVRRIVLSVLHTADPEAILDVEEVVARSGSISGDRRDRYLAVQRALRYLGEHGLATAHTESEWSKKWWNITDAGGDQIHTERRELEQEADFSAEPLADQTFLYVPF